MNPATASANNLAVLPGVPIPTNSNIAAAAMPAALAPQTTALLHQAVPEGATGPILDAQSIQAQVEALIQSTSSSVAASTADGQVSAPQDSALPNLIPPPAAAAAAAGPILGQPDTSAGVTPLEGTRLAAPPLLPAPAAATRDSSQMAASNSAVPIDAALTAGPSFQNTFAQYQFPQVHDRALEDAVLADTAADAAAPVKEEGGASLAMTREEEERAADALIEDVYAPETTAAAATKSALSAKPEPFSGADLAAAAKAIGIEADADLLSGTGEDQRALAAAIKRLGDAHGEAAQKAIQQAAAAAAAAAAARASQELARAAASEQGIVISNASGGASNTPGPSRTASSASPAPRRSATGPRKRFPCPKCDKAFARAYNLNTHLSTHDPDPNRSKPFPCPYPSCKSEGGRSFSRKHDLQRHVASIHENEAEPGIHGDPEEVIGGETGGLVSLGLGTPGKKFRCNGCGRSFVRRDACNRHQCDSSPLGRTSTSPSSTPYASSVSPRPNGSLSVGGMGGGGGLPPARSAVGSPYSAGSGTASRASPAASTTCRQSSLSKEVQAVAKQLQARVEAQSPGPQGAKGSRSPQGLPPQSHQRSMASGLAGGERRNFPLSAISLYASTGPSSSSSTR